MTSTIKKLSILIAILLISLPSGAIVVTVVNLTFTGDPFVDNTDNNGDISRTYEAVHGPLPKENPKSPDRKAAYSWSTSGYASIPGDKKSKTVAVSFDPRFKGTVSVNVHDATTGDLVGFGAKDL